MGIPELLIIILVAFVLPALPFLPIALFCRRTSNRFPALQELDTAAAPPSAASPGVALGQELGRFDELQKAGDIDEAHEYLAGLFRQHRAQRSPYGVQVLIADLLANSLQAHGKSEEAEKILALSSTLKRSSDADIAPSTTSLFGKALVDDNAQVTIETLKLLAAIQGSWRPFRSAFLPVFYRVVRFVTVIVGFLAILALRSARQRDAEALLAVIGVVAFIVLLVGFVYRFYCIRTTKYELKEGALIYRRGGLTRYSRTFELYRLHDVAVKCSLWNRLTGDARLDLRFDKDGPIVKLPGWVKSNEVDHLAMTLRNVSRVLRTNANIKGILT